MGVSYNDCRRVASLLGIRAFLSEFVAYEELGILIANRKVMVANNYTGRIAYVNDDVILLDFNNTRLKNGIISVSIRRRGQNFNAGDQTISKSKGEKGKLGTYAMKRVAAWKELPGRGRGGNCLDSSFLPQ